MRTMAVVGALVLLGAVAVAASVEIHHFWSATCPDCLVMKAFLAELSQARPELVIVEHEVTFSPDNWRRMATLAEAYGVRRHTTPMVFVGDLAVTGIGLAVELQIEEEVLRCIGEGCPSPLERLPARLRWVLSPLEIVLVLALGVAAILLLTR